MKNYFTSKKSLQKVSIPTVKDFRNTLFDNNNVVEQPKQEQVVVSKPDLSSTSFVDSGIKLLMTKDYDRFIFRKDNRKIDYRKIHRLVKSIKKTGALVVPGTVNGKLEIIDGQSRLLALKHLAETEGIYLPFYFTIQENYGAAEMIAMNSTADTWKNPEYLDHHVENKNENYLLFEKFMRDFDWLNISTAKIIFTGRIDGTREYYNDENDNRRTIRATDFKEGLLAPDDINLAYERAEQLDALGEYYDNFKNTNFVKAFLNVKKVKGFDYEELLSQFERVFTNKRNDKFQIKDDLKHTINSYRDCINDIYNFKKHEHKCLNLRSVKRK